jgi:hypothetical protein
MSSFVFDDLSWNKSDAFVVTNTICEKFLLKNHLDFPHVVLNGELKQYKKSKWTHYGWYDFQDKIVYVNIKKSRPPTKTPGFSWSFPCSRSDLTVVGITAHEYGHHIHNCLEEKNIISNKELFKILKKIKKVEKPVSGYEPNSYEMMAEMLRIFILNPTLLEEGRPIRWALLTESLKLNPIHSIHWKKMLYKANERIVESNQNWVYQK